MFAVSFAAEAASFTRAPHLDSVTPTSAIVAFNLGSSCPATVRYGTSGQTNQSASSSGSATAHGVSLTGLQPGTVYTYSVEACGAAVGSPYSFKTATPPSTQSVHFAAFGDFGTGSSGEAALSKAVEAANPELVVTLGDNAYESGTAQEVQDHIFAPFASWLPKIPFYPALGNHEYVTNYAQPSLDAFYLPTNNPKQSERYYSFDWGFVHFAVLDSSCAVGYDTGGKCTQAEQTAWLKTDLAASTAPWKIVAFHHPPWSTGASHGSELNMRHAFAPIMEQYGVDLVLTGHDHDYERSQPMIGDGIAPAGQKGIVYLVVGTGSAGSAGFSGSQPSWSVYRNASVVGYFDAQVQGGTLTGRMVDTSGKTIDTFTLNKTVAAPAADPKLTVTAERAVGLAPLDVGFVAQVDNLSNPTVSWNFGDGGTATGLTPRHTFTRTGNFDVTATATSGSTTLTSKLTITAQDASGQPAPPVSPPPTSSGTGGGSATPSTSTSPLGLRQRRRDRGDALPARGAGLRPPAAVLARGGVVPGEQKESAST